MFDFFRGKTAAPPLEAESENQVASDIQNETAIQKRSIYIFGSIAAAG